jgi:hypothetical protein
MKITKATYDDQGKGKDRSIYTDIECALENKSENTIEMTKGSVLLLDEGGVVIGNDADREDDSYADTNESYSVSYSPYIDCPSHVGDVSKIKAIVDITSFRREFFKLGEYDCPNEPAKPVKSTYEKQTGDIRIHGVYIFQQEPYEDAKSGDDVQTEVRVYVRNIGDKFIEKVKAKVQLLDKEEASIETNEDSRSIAPSSSDVLIASMYAKPGKLKGATVKVSLSIFYAVEHFHAEEPLTMLKD